MPPFYQFSATSLTGQPISMADYAGKVVLVVNTASHCGFTPQYAGLEALYQKYAAQGLVVLGYPCNQFGKQEPGNADDISQTCHVNYGVSFPMFGKVEVNGSAAHPIFRYLKAELGLSLVPGRIEGVAGAVEVAEDRGKILPQEVGQHEAVVQGGAPAHEAPLLRLAPQPGDEGA